MKAASAWSGLLGAPLAWFAMLFVAYALVPWACRSGHQSVLHVIVLLTAATIATCAVVSWQAWRRSLAPPQAADVGRDRFLAWVAFSLAALLTLLAVASEVPVLVLRACD